MGDIQNPPWVGLWLKDGCSFICVIQEDWEAELFVYTNEEEMRTAWHNLDLAIEKGCPDPDDIIIWQVEKGPLAWAFGPADTYPDWEGLAPTSQEALGIAAAWALEDGREGIQFWRFQEDKYYLLEWV